MINLTMFIEISVVLVHNVLHIHRKKDIMCLIYKTRVFEKARNKRFNPYSQSFLLELYILYEKKVLENKFFCVKIAKLRNIEM